MDYQSFIYKFIANQNESEMIIRVSDILRISLSEY